MVQYRLGAPGEKHPEPTQYKLGPETGEVAPKYKLGPPTGEEVKAPPPPGSHVSSSPVSQAIAGLVADTAGLPAVPGLIGAAAQAGYNTLTGDKGFGENFDIARSDGGIDQSLIETGIGARKYMMDKIGVGEAQTTTDQIARTLGGFLLPVPMGFLGGAAATGLKGALGKAATFALPTVRMGPKGARMNNAFRKRAVTSLGVGTAADQGFRALDEDPNRPLMLSEQALTGIMPEANKPTITQPLIDGEIAAEEQMQLMNEQVEREKNKQGARTGLKVALAVLAGGAAVKWARSGSQFSPTAQVGNALSSIHRDTVDKAGYISEALRSIGRTEENIAKTIHNAHVDTTDIALNWRQTGELPQDYVPEISTITGKRKKMLTPEQMDNRKVEMGAEKAAVFERTLIQERELALLQQAEKHGTHELFPNHRRTMSSHEKAIIAARNDPAVSKLLDDVHETYDSLLDYAKQRGNQTKDTVSVFRENNTLKIGGLERVVYAPMYAKDTSSWYARMANRYLGLTTKEGRRHQYVANEYGKAGIDFPQEAMSSTQAMHKYATSTISHVNNESFKGHILDNLSQIKRGEDGVPHRAQHDVKTLDANGNTLIKVEDVPTAKDVTYIGKGTDLDDINRILIDIFDGDELVKARWGTKTNRSLADLERVQKGGDELMTVHMGGEIRVYHVPDKGLRAALDLDPKLTAGWQALANWKSLFSKFTTGPRSLFAPFSGLFSTQQIATNTASRAGLISGFASVGRSLKGTARLMFEAGSGDISRFLSRRIARQMGDTPPTYMKNLEKRLDKKFKDSILNMARRETGRTTTGFNIGHGTIDDVMERIGPASSDFFGKDAMGLVRDLWSTWNTAWHEGPAYGAMHKHIGDVIKKGGDINPQVIRDAVDVSKSLAGDMNRIGASQFAKNFNAAIPFSSAMIQSWNSIGASARGNYGKFMIGAVGLIGMPTVSELIYNQVVNDTPDPATGQPRLWQDAGNPNKYWTYSDYYWNKFTTEQRINNFIYFKPNSHPSEAILIPVSPEWSLFRATTIEAMDAVFNLSDVGATNVINSKPGQAGADGEKFKEMKFNRDHFVAALARVLDIPLPPPLAAAYSAAGLDVRFGLAYKEYDNPDSTEGGFNLISAHKIGQGERVTRSLGKTRFTEGELSRTATAVIQDIFGAAGAQYVNVHNAVASGFKGKDGSFTRAISNGFDAFGQTSKEQSRYLQPLLGKSVYSNNSGKEAREMFAIKEVMKSLDKNWKLIEGGGVILKDGVQLTGHDQITISDDPKAMELGQAVTAIKADIADMDTQIANIKLSTSTMGHSNILGSASQKRDKMDANNVRIQDLKAQQLSLIHQWEENLGDHLTQRYGTDRATGKIINKISVDLSKFQPGPQVTQGLSMKEFIKPR